MMRLVVYFAGICLLAGLAAWFANHPGNVLISWFGYEAETSVGVLIIGAALLSFAVYSIIRAARLIVQGPAAFARMRATQRRSRKLRYVLRGFSAAAIGDADGARKALKSASGGDDLGGLKKLLAAQIAEIDRDEGAVEEAYRDLLKHSDTEFLGLRGLYESALRQGDREAALAFATRAFEARPRSPWLAEQLFRVQAQSGAWEMARKTLTNARRSNAVSRDAARRREGVVLAAEALSAEASGNKESALKLAQRSLSLAPGLTPMALLVAKAQMGDGQTWAASGTLEAAWRVYPQPDLGVLYRTLKVDESQQQTARRMMGLAEFNPNHVESRILVASEALRTGELRRARRALRPALDTPSARVLMLMGDIASKTLGGEEEAQAFRVRAVSAPRDAQWVCSECGRERDNWVPVCDSCGAFDTHGWASQGILSSADLVLASTQQKMDWQEDLAEAAPIEPDPLSSNVIPAPLANTPSNERRGAVDLTGPRQPDDPGVEDTEKAPVARVSY